MSMDRAGILRLLEKAGISYDLLEHPPIYTVEDGEKLNLPNPSAIAKNLFLRDGKGENYYLLSMPAGKQLDLKGLRSKLESRRLTFASAEELHKRMKLPRGAVTPFGALNDENHTVTVIFDLTFEDGQIAVPLNENTATVWLPAIDLAKLIQAHGNKVRWLDL